MMPQVRCHCHCQNPSNLVTTQTSADWISMLSTCYSAAFPIVQFPFNPMQLSRRARPFNHPEWLFELKYDGFRALARIKRGQCQLISRNGHPFSSFAELGKSIALALPQFQDAVLDGEIVCLDRRGRP